MAARHRTVRDAATDRPDRRQHASQECPPLRDPLLDLADRVSALVPRHQTGPAPAVAISGIDGAGKGHLASRLAQLLSSRGLRPALIGIDPWLNPPALRELPLSDPQAGPHFYRTAFDFPRLVATLIQPLRQHRSIRLSLQLGGQLGTPRTEHYTFHHADVVIVEGIFLLRRELVHLWDLRVWVACSRATALRRALARNQEGLPPQRIHAEYAGRYFPAQDYHLRTDDPVSAADLVINNDTDNITDTDLHAPAPPHPPSVYPRQHPDASG